MTYRNTNAVRYDRGSPSFLAGAHKNWAGKGRAEVERLVTQDRQFLELAREQRGKNTPAHFRFKPIPPSPTYSD